MLSIVAFDTRRFRGTWILDTRDGYGYEFLQMSEQAGVSIYPQVTANQEILIAGKGAALKWQMYRAAKLVVN